MDKKLELCQTCLSNDRNLYPLVKLKNAISIFNVKINMEGGVCWECKRYIQKFYLFRNQVGAAQVMLNSCKKIENLQPLSKLRTTKRIFYYSHKDPITHINVTCSETGPIMIKQEYDPSYFENQVDTGYVQIITKDRTNEDIVYEIEDNININDRGGILDNFDNAWSFDDHDANQDFDWSCGDESNNLDEDFNEQVQKHIVSDETERQLNENDDVFEKVRQLHENEDEVLNKRHDELNGASKNKNLRKGNVTDVSIINKTVQENAEVNITKKSVQNQNEDNIKIQDVAKKKDKRVHLTGKGQHIPCIVTSDHDYCQNEAADHNIDHVVSNHYISELPRITMVKSIQDHPSLQYKEPVEFTEIIELNISIPVPDSSGSETTSGHIRNETTEEMSDDIFDSINSDSFDKTCSGFDKTDVGGSKIDMHVKNDVAINSNAVNISSTERSKTKNVNDNVIEKKTRKDSVKVAKRNIATTSKIDKGSINKNNQKNIPEEQTNVNKNVIFISPSMSTSRSVLVSNPINTSQVTSTITNKNMENKNEPKNVKEKDLNINNTSKTNEGVSSTNSKAQTNNIVRSNEISTTEVCSKETGSKVVASTSNKNVDASMKSKEKDTITVKVKYLEKPPFDFHEVPIKSEPVSDDEDIIVEDCSAVDINQEVNNESVKVENMTQSMDEEQLQYKMWKTSALLVYNSFRDHKYATTFLHAVSDAIAPDYSKVVKKPAFLVGIRKKIFDGDIRTTAEFHREMLLMLTNALMYNSSDHPVFGRAKDFLEETKLQMGVLKSVFEESTSGNDVATPRPRSKRRQDLEEKIAKRPKLDTTPVLVGKVDKTDKKGRFKSKIVPNPLTLPHSKSVINEKNLTLPLSKRIKKEKVVDRKSKNDAEKKNKRVRSNQALITVEVEKKQAEVKKVSENCLLIGSKVISVPNSSDTDDGPIASVDRVSKVNEKHVSTNYSTRTKSTIDVKPKIKEIIIKQTPKRRGRKPRNVIKCEKDEIAAFNIKGKRSKSAVNLKEHFEELAKMPDLSPIVKLEPLSIPDNYSQESDNPETSDDYCVAITTEPQKDMTHDEASLVKKVLEEKILQIALDFSKFAPRFRGKPIIADGVVKLWCEDAPSLKWLKKTVSELKGGFVVKKQVELPKKIRSAILIPSSNGEMAVTQKILAAQNPWAQVASWAFYSCEQRGENMILVIGIPSTLIPVVLNKHRRLAYILGSVHIKFYNSEGKLVDSPPK